MMPSLKISQMEDGINIVQWLLYKDCVYERYSLDIVCVTNLVTNGQSNVMAPLGLYDTSVGDE